MQCKTMQCKTIKCKIDNHLEKSGQFWNRPENWQWSRKIRTVLKPSGKLAMIRKNPDRFGSIGTVEQFFSVVHAKTFRTRKNFLGSNATFPATQVFGPLLHGKCHFRFPFWLLEPLPYVNIAHSSWGDYKQGWIWQSAVAAASESQFWTNYKRT